MRILPGFSFLEGTRIENRAGECQRNDVTVVTIVMAQRLEEPSGTDLEIETKCGNFDLLCRRLPGFYLVTIVTTLPL
jgi:hypothetical protein